MSEKCPLILFSGGLDSTYLLWKEARNPENAAVWVVYADAQQGEAKKSMEKKARRRIIDKLNCEQDAKPIFTLTSDSTVYLANTPSAAFRQPLGWLVAAMEVVDPDIHTSVMIAYVEGDQITQNFNELKTAWQAVWSFTKQGPVVPLEFPLNHTSKVSIFKELPPDYYDEIWYCELPSYDGDSDDGTACGQCVPCITHATELHRYSLMFKASLSEMHAIYRKADEPQPKHPVVEDKQKFLDEVGRSFRAKLAEEPQSISDL